jgi:hypothetical protein
VKVQCEDDRDGSRVHRRGLDGPPTNVKAADREQVPAVAIDDRPESVYKGRLLGDLHCKAKGQAKAIERGFLRLH